MLTSEEIKQRIIKLEGQQTAFKLTLEEKRATDSVKKSLVAFSNDYHQLGGGVIIFGVDDQSQEIKGIDSPDSLILRLTGICRDGIVPTLTPSIEAIQVDEKTLVVVELPMSNRRPHRVNDKCYIRIGASNRVATPDEEFELMRRTGQMPYDLSPVRSAGVSDLDMYSFMDGYLPKRVSNEVLMENGRKPEEWLIHLRLAYREGEKIIPTVAAILLFGKAPQQFLPHANIDFIRFEGLDKSYPIVDRKHINGTLKQQIESAVQLVERYTIQGYQFSNDSPIRKDTVEYPLRAIREVVANAIVIEITSIQMHRFL